MTPVRRATALVALLAFLALSTLGAGWVVCTGANGHVAVEALASGCCGDDHDGTPAERDDDDDDDRDCGDCEDVLLAKLTPSRLAEPRPPDVAAQAAALPPPALRRLPTETAHATPRLPRGPPRPPPPARHLATTVLLL